MQFKDGIGICQAGGFFGCDHHQYIRSRCHAPLRHIKPRPLSRQEVDRIFKRAAEKKAVVKVDLAEGDQIMVTAGPFKDFQGEVIEVSGERNKLKALLSIFGRETPVELEFSQISKQS